MKNLYIFLSTFLIPIAIIVYLFFPSVRPVLLLHNLTVAFIGQVDLYFRFLKNRQPIEQVKILGLPTDISSVLSSLLHLLLLIIIIYRPIVPLEIPMYSHVLMGVVVLLVFGLPWWPYSITRMEMFLIYVVTYVGLFAGSIILNNKLIEKI